MNTSCATSSNGASIGGDGAHADGRRLRRVHPSLVSCGGRQASGAMTFTRGARTLATAALLLVALAACSDGDGYATPPATTSAPTATTSPTPLTESQIASNAAEAKVREYYDTLNLLRQDSTQPISELKSVAISVELTAQQHLVRSERRKGRRQVGESTIAELQTQSVSLDNSDPKAGKVPSVFIDVCWDVSDVDVVDKGGKSVVVANRPDTGWTRYTVANYRYVKDPEGAWRVSGGEDLKKAPCSPAA